jgi:two-component system cell cycle response regulator
MSVRRARIFGWPSPEEEETRTKATFVPSVGSLPPAQALESLGPDSLERRRVRRNRVLLRGKLVFDGGKLSTDCIVRDMSVWGARVRMPTEIVLRDDLYLIESQNCMAYESKVVWKKGHDLGLQFLGRRDLEVTTVKMFRDMRDIWLELRHRSGVL